MRTVCQLNDILLSPSTSHTALIPSALPLLSLQTNQIIGVYGKALGLGSLRYYRGSQVLQFELGNENREA